MSIEVNGIVTWLRTFFDDIYAPKGTTGLTLSDVYPVGAIYMSVNNTSPATLFGGTWQKIEGRFLLASGDLKDSQNNVLDSYTLGDTDGENEHTLVLDEVPSHNHGSKSLTGSFRVMTWTGTASGIVSPPSTVQKDRTASSGSNMGNNTFNVDATHTHDSEGGGQAHNNMPPYLVVNVWKRTG